MDETRQARDELILRLYYRWHWDYASIAQALAMHKEAVRGVVRRWMRRKRAAA